MFLHLRTHTFPLNYVIPQANSALFKSNSSECALGCSTDWRSTVCSEFLRERRETVALPQENVSIIFKILEVLERRRAFSWRGLILNHMPILRNFPNEIFHAIGFQIKSKLHHSDKHSPSILNWMIYISILFYWVPPKICHKCPRWLFSGHTEDSPPSLQPYDL